jgi:transcriptional regulator with XRE-family HTH domain
MSRDAGTRLGTLIQVAREKLGMSQEQLADKLGLARPISVSKWERGVAPLPVHHWQALIRLLKLSRKDLLDAAQADHHKQLLVFTSLTGSFAPALSELSETSWAFVMRSLNPKVAAKVEQIRAANTHLTPAILVNLAIAQFVDALQVEVPVAHTVNQAGRSTVHHFRRGMPAGAPGFRQAQG